MRSLRSKKGFRARMAENYSKANEQLKAEEAAKAERKAAKEAAEKRLAEIIS